MESFVIVAHGQVVGMSSSHGMYVLLRNTRLRRRIMLYVRQPEVIKSWIAYAFDLFT
jgi:hypothetical protein